MEKVKNVPELRFPEFEGEEYSKFLFEEIFTFSTGKNIKQNEASPQFQTPCVRYGELYHMYKEVITKVLNKTNLDKTELVFSVGDEILLPSAGEDPIDIGSASALTIPNVAIGRTINILRPKEKSTYLPIFLSYYINQKLKRKIALLAKGVSISNVYNSDLKKLSTLLPIFSEQKKIADFLTAVDRRIALLERKRELLEQYKRGVMQQLFSRQLRFKDENGNDYPEWEEKRLGEVLDYEQPTKYLVESLEYSDKYETPVLTAGKSFILGFTNEVNGIYENLPTIIFDDFTTSFHFVYFPFKVKSSAMKMLTAKPNQCDLKFVFEVMKILKFTISEHKRYWISEYSQLFIPVPKIAEQQKVSKLSNQLDSLINGHNLMLKRTSDWKKGLLQKMFV